MDIKTGFRKKERIEDVVGILLWTMCIASLSMVGASVYQLIKDTYFFVGATFLLLIVLMVRRAQMNSCIIWVYLIGYALYVGKYLYDTRMDYGNEYRMYLIARFAMVGLFVWVILDIIFTANISKVSKQNYFLVVMCAISFGLVVVDRFQSAFVLICPTLALYFTPIDKGKWNQLVKQFAFAGYISYTILMCSSVLLYPHEYSGDRYVGFLRFPAAIGIIASLAIICSFYLVFVEYKEVLSKSKRCLAFAISSIFPLYGLFRAMDKTAMLSMLMLALSWYVFASNEKQYGREVFKKRVIVAVFALVLTISAAMIILYGLGQLYEPLTDEITPSTNNGAKRAIIYVSKIGSFITNPIDYYGGLWGDRKWLYVIDNMLSGRLGLWYLGIKQTSLLGSVDTQIFIPNGYKGNNWYPHVHNTYIQWVLSYGYVVGIALTLWVFSCYATSAKEVLHNKKSCVMSFLWISYVLSFAMFERENWTALSIMLLLIFQYPLLVRNVDEICEGQ